jgi:hypothetical protein
MPRSRMLRNRLVRFETDENLLFAVAVALREAGFDAEIVWDEALTGTADRHRSIRG